MECNMDNVMSGQTVLDWMWRILNGLLHLLLLYVPERTVQEWMRRVVSWLLRLLHFIQLPWSLAQLRGIDMDLLVGISQ